MGNKALDFAIRQWATITVALGMLLGRVTGLLRELVIAAKFGVSSDGDVASLAVNVPDFLNGIFIAGAISAILIPEYHRLERESAAKAKKFLAQFSTVVVLAATLLTFVVLLLIHPFVSFLAPGFATDTRRVAADIVCVALFAFPVCTLTAVGSAALQARNSVAAPALGTFIFNLALILGVFVAGPSIGTIGWVILCAALLRWAVQLPACWQHEVPFATVSLSGNDRQLDGRIAIKYLQAAAAIIGTLSVPVVARAFASYQSGGFASLSYATKLAEVPIGLCSAILTMVYFPKISRALQNCDGHELTKRTTNAMAIVYFGVLPLMVIFISASDVFTGLLFRRGNMDATQIMLVSELSRISFLAAPAVVLSGHMMGIFQARGDTRFPLAVSLATLAVLFVVLPVGRYIGGLAGIVASVVVIQSCQCLVLWYAVGRKHGIAASGVIRRSDNWLVFSVTLAGLVLSWTVRHLASSVWSQLICGIVIAAALTICIFTILRKRLSRSVFDSEQERPSEATAWSLKSAA